MKRTVEVVVTILVLSGLYFTVPASVSRVDNPGVRNAQVVLIADGSDPMPLCRGKQCK